jgi:hypothetical protein
VLTRFEQRHKEIFIKEIHVGLEGTASPRQLGYLKYISKKSKNIEQYRKNNLEFVEIIPHKILNK